MKKLKFLSLALFTVLSAALFTIGCGNDSVTPPPPSTNPTINMTVGSVYTLNVDSIQTNGTVTGTRFKTIQTCLSQGTYFGQSNVFQVRAVTQDSVTSITIATDTFYVRYDAGKFYQYGIIQLLDPTITPTWDLIADFTVSQGTQWTIASNVSIHIGSLTATATIKGKIAADTTFNTYGWGNKSVHSFRAEISADIFLGIPLGTVYVDYFIGDANPSTNPSGLVRLRLRPVNITGYTAAGVDQKMQKWTP